MRTSKTFLFNESTTAEAIILNGFQNGVIDNGKMYLVAKYIREKMKYGETRLERELIRFCKMQDINFNPVIEADQIKKWVKSALMYDLREVSSIIITEKEIEFLKSIRVVKDRKVLFAILVLAKALKKRSTKRKKKALKVSPNFYIHYNNLGDIVKMLDMRNFTEEQITLMINKYKEHFFVYGQEKELLRVEYADPAEEGTEIFNLEDLNTNFENMLSLEKHFCVDCGKPFVKRSNSKKRCDECAETADRNKKRKWISERRRNVDE